MTDGGRKGGGGGSVCVRGSKSVDVGVDVGGYHSAILPSSIVDDDSAPHLLFVFGVSSFCSFCFEPFVTYDVISVSVSENSHNNSRRLAITTEYVYY